MTGRNICLRVGVQGSNAGLYRQGFKYCSKGAVIIQTKDLRCRRCGRLGGSRADSGSKSGLEPSSHSKQVWTKIDIINGPKGISVSCSSSFLCQLEACEVSVCVNIHPPAGTLTIPALASSDPIP